jgi:copper(I)-binding protein
MQSFEDKKMRTLHRSRWSPSRALCAAIATFRATITIGEPWARASIGDAGNTAAYMKLENGGDAPDRLLSAKSEVAERASLHESRAEGDVMKMGPVEGGIEVPAHGTAELKPLGLHVMLMGLNRLSERPRREAGRGP